MKLKPLFARATTGAVQQWQIEVEGPKFRTHAGQMGGAITTTQWTVCEPKNTGRKNGTTAEEQALVEAKAKQKKKMDAGYKENVNDIDTVGFLEPMLAKDYHDYTDRITFPIFSQPKLDGIRIIARKEGLFSRKGKAFYPWPHIL